MTTPSIRVLSYVCDGRVGARAELPEAIRAAFRQGVDVISGQGNGMDMGPYYLGAGDAGAAPLKQNFEAAILGAKEAGVPFVFSLGGRAGADAHLEVYLQVIDQIARDNGVSLRAAVISGEISKSFLSEKLRAGVKMPRLFDTPRLSPHLTEQDLDESIVIQAQMGPEPIIEAMKLFAAGEIDGVFTGRALDSGVHMAYPMFRGFPVAGAAHLAKIIECGSMCCEPPTPVDTVMAELSDEGEVVVWPPLERQRCTVSSVAGHAVYERENPFEERNPGGILDITTSVYQQLDERTVKTAGARWRPVPYAIKLEGVKRLGFETDVVAVAADPGLIEHIHEVVDNAIAATRESVEELEVAPSGDFDVVAHVIGSGALPSGQADEAQPPSEITILLRVVAPTREAALNIATTTRLRLQMADFPGRTTTAGNFAFPLPRTFIEQGETFVYNIWHLLPLEDPTEPFSTRIVEFPRS
jgi:Acyclic terpene utilisation family protein AtuA